MGCPGNTAGVPAGSMFVLSKNRVKRYPSVCISVPTVDEAVPGFEMSSWIGLFAPAGTPADIIAKLNAGVTRVLTAESVKEKLANLGLVVVAGKPEELADVVKTGLQVRGELVKAAGIQPE